MMDFSRSSKHISIHTLRVEGDVGLTHARSGHGQFLSTPSVWRVTPLSHVVVDILPISIHTLRVEGDWCQFG